MKTTYYAVQTPEEGRWVDEGCAFCTRPEAEKYRRMIVGPARVVERALPEGYTPYNGRLSRISSLPPVVPMREFLLRLGYSQAEADAYLAANPD